MRFIPAGAGNTSLSTAGRKFGPVYPRWRGEHFAVSTSHFSRSGLSPLARGTLELSNRPGSASRFIPAGAGNTSLSTAGRKFGPVYPRWRGEHFAVSTSHFSRSGLSPLARGTLELSNRPGSASRFIPAGAGNTDKGIYEKGSETVYPRWRGEHRLVCSAAGNTCGLSPLARGTRGHQPPRTYALRFIPAGAGNTLRQKPSSALFAVYPRWRGEHPLVFVGEMPRVGLSPLARGTLYGANNVTATTRFIPADAGNTARPSRSSTTATVYPRWRGEHHTLRFEAKVVGGLSPLARGTLYLPLPLPLVTRFIPAGAGNTNVPGSTGRHLPVYPRWRGEHQGWLGGIPLKCGLSPLARGTRALAHPQKGKSRFIPAGAGNTRKAASRIASITVYPRWRGEHLTITYTRAKFYGLSPLARGTLTP